MKKKKLLAILLLIFSVFVVQIHQPFMAMEFEENIEAQSDAEIVESLEELISEEVQEENVVDGVGEAEHADENPEEADPANDELTDDSTEGITGKENGLSDDQLEPIEESQDVFNAPVAEVLAFSPMRQRGGEPYVITNDADPDERYVMTTYSDLQNKITALAGENKAYTLTLNKDLVVTGDASLTFLGTSTWTVEGNNNTVKKAEDSPVNLNRVITIGATGSPCTVTLNNVVIDGENTYRTCEIKNGSALTLGFGAVIQNGYSDSNDRTGGIHMDYNTKLYMKPGSELLNNISEIGSYHGGAIRMSSSSVVDIDGADISGNSARFNGGAIYADPGATSLTIKNTTFSGNKADTGGAIYSAVVTEIRNCTFENNEAIANGGAIYTNPNAAGTNSLTIEDTSFSGNKAGSLGAQRDGGAIYSQVKTDIKRGTFKKNTATREGGAIFTPSTTVTKNLLIDGTIFSENKAKDGGAIYSSAIMTISNASFLENKANKDGGGIYAYKSKAVKIVGTTFKKNHALGTATPGTRGNGGAIYAHKDTQSLIITDTNFSENTAQYGGGAVSSNAPMTTIEGASFEENSVQNNGGAIAIDGACKLKIAGAEFSDNSAAFNGGAIFASPFAESLDIENTTFSRNTATYQGGAVFSRVNTTIKGGKFEGNRAQSGGAFYTDVSKSLKIDPFTTADNTTENTIFSQNEAEYGGAIYSCADTNISKAIFQENTASSDGGGIYAFMNAVVKIDDTRFQNNTAQNNGGAIFANRNATSLSLQDTTLSENKADKSGGAVYSHVPTTIDGGSFEKNTAGIDGGAINLTNHLNASASLTTEGTAFTQNKAAKGGAIFTRADTTITNNTSFSENEASAEGGAIYTFFFSYADPAADDKYNNLEIDNTVSFENNKAAYPYQPPENHENFADLLFSTTTFTDQENPHSGSNILTNDALLNNYDINYKNSSHNDLYPISYSFVDAGGNPLTQQEVLDLLPADSEAGIGSIVIPASLTSTNVELVNGKWAFQGWDKTQVDIPQGGVNFVGKWLWTSKKYNVSFIANGGTSVASQTVNHGEKATKPTPDPTKEGYAFDGWFAPAATEAFDFDTAITNDLTLTAKWIKLHTVSFDTAGGTAVVAQTVEHGATATKPTDPTKDNHDFAGWYQEAAAENAFDFTTPITADTTVYAKWTLNEYTVSFDTAGGTAVVAQTVEHGATATKPTDPTKDGHDFAGWYADLSLNTEFDFATAITADTTVYAKWTLKEYTVSFDAQGGSTVASQTVQHGNTATKPATDPTRDGYSFGGWYQEAAAENAFDFTTPITADTTVYAKWTLKEYIVSFDTAGGTAVDSQTVKHGNTATKPADPTKDNYDFGGWYADSAFNNEFNFTTPITSDTTVYAKWTLKGYTVSFDTAGGTAVDSQTVEHGATATKPATDPTRDGHAFGGWHADAAAENAFDFTTPITAATTVYAKWTLKEYTVSFDAQGGSTAASQTVQHGNTATKPADPTKEGYGFAGWYQEAAAENAFDFTTPITADTTVYAKWMLKEYTVSFDAQGGSTVASQTVQHGSTATKPADPMKEGYDFGGWYQEAAAENAFDFTTPITTDTTVYAKWTLKEYTVSFDTQGGSPIVGQTVRHDETATKPADPMKEGYDFAGWYQEAAAENAFDFTTPITDNTTVYAKWTANKYTVSFDAQGGSTVASQTVQHGNTVTKPATDPTRDGYAFGGWHADAAAENAFDFTTPITANTTVYAKWTLKEYTVSFDAQGGSTVASQTVQHGNTATKPADPTKEGYDFGGWYADSAFNNEFNFTTPITADTTLYAKWAIKKYTVSFDTAGGTAVDSQTVEHGATATKPANPTKDGHDFAGWYQEAAAENAFDFATPITSVTTVYAKWTLKEYTVSFDTAGGAAVGSQTVEHGATAIKPADPTKEGYDFAGWYQEAAAENAFDFTTPITADTTLYAKWAIKKYTVSFDTAGGAAVDSQTVKYGDKATKPAPEPVKTGYAFDGWFAPSAMEPFDFDTAITNDLTLTAKWTKLHTVSFDTQGGSPIAGQTVRHDETATKPADPTKDNYDFAGWYQEAAAENAFDFTTPITAATTVYAKWTLKEYTVSFDTAGGTAVVAQTVEHGATATKPADPTKDGHDFAGWYQEAAAGNAFDFSTVITADTTVYAKWTMIPTEPIISLPIFYSITYVAEADVEDVPVDNNQYRSGAKVTILGPPTREGYEFLGWRMNHLLQPGDVIKVDNADIVLTAEWQEVETGIPPLGTTTPTQTTETTTTKKVEELVKGGFVKTGENLGLTFLFGCLSILVAFILLFIRERFKREER